MANEAKYWILANKAAKQLGWLAETIFTQWSWETAHFTSANLLNNNNIAGQTWTSANPTSMRGTARAEKEGGYYIKYADPVQGYVDFIKKNHRYDGVKNAKSVEAQIDAIAKAGWATDPHYAAGLKSLHQYNIQHGYYKLPREEAPKAVTKPVAPKMPAVKVAVSKANLGIKSVGKIKIVEAKRAVYIVDRPSVTGDNLTTIDRGSEIDIAGSIPGWWEVIYHGKRAYVKAEYAKKI
jgi:hypothetical protein